MGPLCHLGLAHALASGGCKSGVGKPWSTGVRVRDVLRLHQYLPRHPEGINDPSRAPAVHTITYIHFYPPRHPILINLIRTITVGIQSRLHGASTGRVAVAGGLRAFALVPNSGTGQSQSCFSSASMMFFCFCFSFFLERRGLHFDALWNTECRGRGYGWGCDAGDTQTWHGGADFLREVNVSSVQFLMSDVT